MLSILIYFFMGIGLSMDTFSLALSLGTLYLSKRDQNLLSVTIGIFHFVMPLLGKMIGSFLYQPFFSYTHILSAFLFFFLSLEMYFHPRKEESSFSFSLGSILLLSMTVSLDSFSVGVLLGIQKKNIHLPGFFFSFISFFFTKLGLWIGETFRKKYEKISQRMGSVLLLLIGIKYLLIG